VGELFDIEETMSIEADDIIKCVGKYFNKTRQEWVPIKTIAQKLYGDVNKEDIIHSIAESKPEFFAINKAKLKLKEDGTIRFNEIGNNTSTTEVYSLGGLQDAIDNYIQHLSPTRLTVTNVELISQYKDEYLYKFKVKYSGELFISTETPVEYLEPGTSTLTGYVAHYDEDDESLYITLRYKVNNIEPKSNAWLRLWDDRVWNCLKNIIDLYFSELPKSLNWLKRSQIGSKENIVNGTDEMLGRLFETPNVPFTKLLWGPPGSGKTYQIAQYAMELLKRNHDRKEKILLVAPSNLAADAIALELIKHKDFDHQVANKKIIRFGYPKLDEILMEGRILGTSRDDTKDNIASLIRKKPKNPTAEESAKFQSRLHSLLRKLKEGVEEEVHSATILITTLNTVLMNESIGILDMEWNTVIVDELSMVNTAFLVPFLGIDAKHTLLCGDPMQLAPIYKESHSNSKWITNNIFDFAKLNSENIHYEIDERYLLLRSQRRCVLKIWNSVKGSYQHVHSNVNHPNSNLIQRFLSPSNDETPISILDTSNFPFLPENAEGTKSESKTGFIRSDCKKHGSTWANKPTARIAVALIRKLNNEAIESGLEISIGVITPYRGQAKEIRKYFKCEWNNNLEKKPNVRIGTIHAFQGSEADVIIFDLCDGKPRSNPGSLLLGDTGQRLFTVGITRTRSKLIFIGDREWLNSNKSKHFAWNKFFDNRRPPSFEI